MSIRYHKEIRNGVVILKLQERDLNQEKAPELKELLFNQLAEGSVHIILDLAGVEDVDSSGLGAFLFGKRQANARGGDLLLVGANDKIKSLIRIAQLTRVFHLFDSLEDAIRVLEEN